MGASSVITIVVSAGSAVLLVYWIVCLAILARKDGAERLHRR